MNDRHEKELNTYRDALDQSRDPVSRILLSHVYLEHLLERYISTKLQREVRDGTFGRNGMSFVHKLKLAWGFGELQDQLFNSINKINSVRNDFVHEFGYSVSHDKIVDLGRTLGKNYKPLEKGASDDADLLSQVLAYICGKAAKFVSVAEDAGT